MNLLKRKKKSEEHSMISNIFYFISLMFSASPLLVIGELLWGVLQVVPGNLVSVLGTKYVIDVVASGERQYRVFIAVAVIAAVLAFSRLISYIFREYFWNTEREKAYFGLNKKLYEKAKSLDLENYDNPAFYNNFILAIESSSENIQYLLNMVRWYFGNLASLLTIGSVLLTIDPVCLGIILCVIIVFAPISRKIADLQMNRRIDNTHFHRRADYFERIFYLGDYAKEVRMNGIAPLLRLRYNDAADDVIKNQKKYLGKITKLYCFQEIGVQVFGFMFVLPLYLGYLVIVKKSLTAGDFVAVFNSAYSIASSINFLSVWAIARFGERSKTIEKYREFFKAEPKITPDGNATPITEPKEIKLEGVSFSYAGSKKPALKNINLTIKPYEKIALVGYNGAGKTTLTNLLLRLYEPTEGKIKIDNTDIRSLTPESHRNRFAAVFQDFQIFACTVGENVALGDIFDKPAVMPALRCAGFDKTLKNGADTELLREFDENGTMLSGGECQKIAVARAFYKNCPYVILDEPSANLDPVAEYELNRAMLEVAEDKTVIFISHRLSTTVNADKIYVMENGEIIESGSHAELMSAGGTYARMFSLQAEKYKS